MALPGSVYVYQGEELGLPEVEDIEPHLIQDPMHFRSGGIDPGRELVRSGGVEKAGNGSGLEGAHDRILAQSGPRDQKRG